MIDNEKMKMASFKKESEKAGVIYKPVFGASGTKDPKKDAHNDSRHIGLQQVDNYFRQYQSENKKNEIKLINAKDF
jgi:hypothetical protein